MLSSRVLSRTSKKRRASASRTSRTTLGPDASNGQDRQGALGMGSRRGRHLFLPLVPAMASTFVTVTPARCNVHAGVQCRQVDLRAQGQQFSLVGQAGPRTPTGCVPPTLRVATCIDPSSPSSFVMTACSSYVLRLVRWQNPDEDPAARTRRCPAGCASVQKMGFEVQGW